MLPNRSYPAKILLFGEYSVILGSEAIALPFSKLEGRWLKGGKQKYDLNPFLGFLDSRSDFDVKVFRDSLEQGWIYESTIPVGYGLGSSGAFTAAVFDAFYAGAHSELHQQREVMAELEGFFHGASSGTDPLISFLRQGIFLQGKEKLEVLDVYPDFPPGDQFFLVDTGLSRSTAPLVEKFLSACRETTYKNQIEQELNPLVATAVEAFLSSDATALRQAWKAISVLQWQLFQPMIPASYKRIWKEGIDSDRYYLKLCGAGGGGFLLGLSPKGNRSQEWLKNNIPGYQALSLLPESI